MRKIVAMILFGFCVITSGGLNGSLTAGDNCGMKHGEEVYGSRNKLNDEGGLPLRFVSSGSKVWLDDSLVNRNSSYDTIFTITNWQPRYPELYSGFTVERLDSMMQRCEKVFYDMYGPRESLKNELNLKKMKHNPDSAVLGLCKMLNWEILFRVGGYWATYSNNLVPLFDWYWEVHTNFTPLHFKYLELSHMKFVGNDKFPLTLGMKYHNDSTIQFAMFQKSRDIREVVHSDLRRPSGRFKEKMDSVLSAPWDDMDGLLDLLL